MQIDTAVLIYGGSVDLALESEISDYIYILLKRFYLQCQRLERDVSRMQIDADAVVVILYIGFGYSLVTGCFDDEIEIYLKRTAFKWEENEFESGSRVVIAVIVYLFCQKLYFVVTAFFRLQKEEHHMRVIFLVCFEGDLYSLFDISTAFVGRKFICGKLLCQKSG